MTAPTLTVMLAYDLPHVRAAFRALVDFESDLAVVAEADDVASLLPVLRESPPDVLVVGLALPAMPDPPELRLVRHVAPHAGVVLVGLEERPMDGPAGPGAPCYVPLGEAGGALANAVRAAARAPTVAFAER